MINTYKHDRKWKTVIECALKEKRGKEAEVIYDEGKHLKKCYPNIN
jgi:hypothetical protein